MLLVLIVVVTGALVYAAAGVLGLVPWRTNTVSTIASGAWLAVADVVLILGTRRITDTDYSTSRRNAHRTAVTASVTMDGIDGELVDISVGGVAVRIPGRIGSHAPARSSCSSRRRSRWRCRSSVCRRTRSGHDVVSCRLLADDWEGYRAMSLWLFHTPAGVVGGMPVGVPAVAASKWRKPPAAVRSFGQAAPVAPATT